MDISVIEPMIGKVFSSVVVSDDREEVIFTTADGSAYKFWHRWECCESVTLEDVVGDLSDLVGVPIARAELVTDSNSWPEDVAREKYEPESYTWSFYKFATTKGVVTLRWYGESNGFYSETVTLRLPDGECWYV